MQHPTTPCPRAVPTSNRVCPSARHRFAVIWSAEHNGKRPMGTFEGIEQLVRHLVDKKRMGDAFEHVIAHYLRHDPTVGFGRCLVVG